MYTVFRQGEERGIGMCHDQFVDEFQAICAEHLKEGRAQAFAFVFYNLMDDSIQAALNSERGYGILNEATGRDITLFYLHSDSLLSFSEDFNKRFLKILNVHEQIEPPCIVFFRVYRDQIEDVDFRSVDTKIREPHLVVEELRRSVVEYIRGLSSQGDISGFTSIVVPLINFLKLGHR